MLKFFLIFVCLLAVLFGLEMLNSVQASVVLPWTSIVAAISALIVKLIDPSVIASGQVLQSAQTGFSVSIEPGCNGVEAAIVLISAILAFPSSWMMKLWGIGLGFLVVQAVNLIRVATLFFIGQWNLKVFEFAHLYMWQALIMLDVLIVWLIWMRLVARRKSASI
jgi:exosortase H (IPTLxxWG-CTERM-specific)